MEEMGNDTEHTRNQHLGFLMFLMDTLCDPRNTEMESWHGHTGVTALV